VAATGMDGVAHVHHTLFPDAHHTAGYFYPGEHIFHHSAALVNYHSRGYTLFFKIVHNINSALTVNLFPSGKGKVNIILRGNALLY
jgi:hypothetical protein